MSDEHGEPNRLIDETSPYLLQHAYNPVDWYPWGEDAFAAAREQNKPVFLSVGYSACHWCHVMERESFEHPQIAELMNRWFINVKVDREERPDVDQIYMTAVQLVTGRGGWPMSVFMTPDGAPFYGGTYWPPVAQQGMIGFADILAKINEYWQQHKDECVSKGQEMVSAIQEIQQQQQVKSMLKDDLLSHAAEEVLKAADWSHGGFGTAPKFPHPVDLKMLMRCWKRFGNEQALKFVRLTLDKMWSGGIYDHLGGGFARYSTDQIWLVPHFEKMLYDNAQLVPLYLDAYAATGEKHYLTVAKETLDYVLREMTSPDGGFYATQDADSEGVEGKFYIWKKAEIDELLGDDAEMFCRCYDVAEGGNWEGHTILNRTDNFAAVQQESGLDDETFEQKLRQCRDTLLEAREKRIHPGRDDKHVLGWNGMMLSAFAQAAGMTGDLRYGDATQKAGEFLLRELRAENGLLWHTMKDGQRKIPGFLDDYACFIEGLTDAAVAVQNETFLNAAVELSEVMIEQFYDDSAEAFLYTPQDHEKLIVRIRDQFDNAIPSGSNLAMHALLKLGQITGIERLTSIATKALDTVSGAMLHQPSGMGQALQALDRYLGPTETLVCAGSDSEAVEELSRNLRNRFSPLATVLPVSDSLADWKHLQELVADKRAVDGELTVYRCQGTSCEAPWVGAEAIQQQLNSLN